MTETLLPALIQQMLRSDFYPHPIAEPVQFIQTHVSYVLLTGEYVYKIKKAVNFGFLDFSTLEKRHHFCQEELRLNQRGAADLYLDVLPITQAGDRYEFSSTGTPFEYAVKMRQFPQTGLFTELLAHEELTETRLEDLARELVKFHQKGAITDYIRSFGKVDRVRHAIDENYEQSEKYIGGPQTQQQFDETREYTDRLFAEQGELFDRRIQGNWIRECHGDVHLRNVCLWNDKIYLFDCIEFNEEFRFVDVMFDVAYIVMDLDVRQQFKLSNCFLNAYLEQMGDWEGLQVLPLYLSRQSYVRAKVTSFLLDDPTIANDPAAQQSITETAAQYYQLAWEYTRPRAGQITLMSGLSGSGKTTLARQLAQQTGAIHIRSDAVRKHLAGVPLEAKGSDELYTPEMNQKTYDRLLQLGLTLATRGYTVILDAKYDRQALRQAAITQAQAHQLPVQIFYCTAPIEVLQARVSHRSGDISDATAAVVAKQHLEEFAESERAYVKTIDTTQNLEAQLKSAEF